MRWLEKLLARFQCLGSHAFHFETRLPAGCVRYRCIRCRREKLTRR